MKTLYLEDYKGKTKIELISSLIEDFEVKREVIERFHILIAYKSVGSYGCDSSAWILLKNKKTKELFEVNASHCSCYGFEGQFEPEETNLDYLKSDKFNFRNKQGGYDENGDKNGEALAEFIKGMRKVNYD